MSKVDNVKYKNGAASAIIKSIPGAIHGIVVNSHTNGTLRFTDGLTTTVAGDKATGTITVSVGNIANDDTVTIGSQTYTFKTALTAPETANEVLLGVSDATALDNLKSAINKSAGGGTTYGSDTVAHAQVVATTNTNTEQTVEAVAIGASYNAVATTETGTNLAWAATTLTGGADPAPIMFNTITFAAGPGVYNFGEGVTFNNGLYATVGGTIDYTILYS
jgi:hypothetical protein